MNRRALTVAVATATAVLAPLPALAYWSAGSSGAEGYAEAGALGTPVVRVSGASPTQVTFHVDEAPAGVTPGGYAVAGPFGDACTIDSSTGSCTYTRAGGIDGTYSTRATLHGWRSAAASSDVDGTAPAVTSVTSAAPNGTYKAGDTIALRVNFGEPVVVTGTPRLALATGSPAATAGYTSGSGTATLTFTYTVGPGHLSGDLDYTGAGALALDGGTMKDAAGNDADLTLAAPGAAGSLSAGASIVVDGVAPTVTSVTADPNSGTRKTGDTVAVKVSFSEPVAVTGTPQLTLATGDPAATAVGYSSGSGTATLTFTYTVAPGNSSADLDYTGAGALALNGGAVRDAAGNAATLTLPAPGAANSLGGNAALVVDGVAPTPASLGFTGTNLAAGKDDTVSVTFSEAPVASSMCSTWSGSGNQSLGGNNVVTVQINNNAAPSGNDQLVVSTTGCGGTFNFGRVDLGNAGYVTSNASFGGSGGNASSISWNAGTRTLTLTLGSGPNGLPAVSTSSTATYVPSSAMTDAAGNAVTGTVTHTGTRF